MKPYIAVCWGICAWTMTGCLELSTKNPPNGSGGSTSTGSSSGSGGAGGGMGVGGMAGGGGNPSTEFCGNGKVEPGEQCDDNNAQPGDGCSAQCTTEYVSSLFVGTIGVAGSTDGIGSNARILASTSLIIFGDTMFSGDQSTVRMVDIATAKVTTIAGLGATSGYADGNGLDARFNTVRALATDGKTLWVSDMNNRLLRAISLIAPYPVTTVAGTVGAAPAPIIDGVGLSAHLDSTRGMTYYNGFVYLVDSSASVLRRFNPVTSELITLAGTAYQAGLADGPGSKALFFEPRSIESDGAGNLYIADSGSGAIRKYDINTSEVKTIVGMGGCGYADGQGLVARSNLPRGISFDGQNLFFTEYQAHTIRQLSLASGYVFTISGTPAACAFNCTCVAGMLGGYADGIGSAAMWNGPYDSAYHKPSKSLFVSDSQNFVIRRLQ